jgi:hypothetical protein
LFLKAIRDIQLSKRLTHAQAVILLANKVGVNPTEFHKLTPRQVAEMIWGKNWRMYIPMSERDVRYI